MQYVNVNSAWRLLYDLARQQAQRGVEASEFKKN
jgi:hypothetical protein